MAGTLYTVEKSNTSPTGAAEHIMSTSKQNLTRQVDGRQVPLVGRYEIDAAHSSIEASVRHLMVAKVRGRFTRFSGTIDVAEEVRESSVALEIEAGSIETGDDGRDGHLRSADFLDVENHPTLSFKSTAVGTGSSDDRWKISGDLTLHGETHTVVLDTEFLGAVIDHRDKHRIAFEAGTEIERDDFGMTWNKPLEAGGFVVGKTLSVTLEIQALADE